MKHLIKLSYLVSILAIIFLPQVSYAEANDVDSLTIVQRELPNPVNSSLISKNYYKKNGRQSYYGGPYQDQWAPYFAPINLDRPYQFPFLQTSVGIGFLRFSGVSGSLSRDAFPTTLGRRSLIRGRLNYSRTPIVEVVLGYSVLDWFQIGAFYQHQGDIDIQTKPQVVPVDPSSGLVVSQFSGSLRLDAIGGKVYFNPPKVLVINAMAFNPYLGLGVGASWQSWTNMRVDTMDFVLGTATSAVTDDFTIKNKYSANCFFMADFGIKCRTVIPSRSLAVSIGCKYNQWGQARNIGLPSQQRNFGFSGLDKQITIKTLYQFAPYVGFQLDF